METRQPKTYSSTAYILAVLAMSKYQNLKNAKITSSQVAEIAGTDATAGRTTDKILSITDPGVLLDEATGKVGQLQKTPGPDIQAKISGLLDQLSNHAKKTEDLLNAKEALLIDCYKSEQSLKELNEKLTQSAPDNDSGQTSNRREIQQKIAKITTSLTNESRTDQIKKLIADADGIRDSLIAINGQLTKDIEARKATSMVVAAMERESKLG